jgi:hypothetical protein
MPAESPKDKLAMPQRAVNPGKDQPDKQSTNGIRVTRQVWIVVIWCSCRGMLSELARK